MAINALWHKRNPMPKSPSLHERLAWHQVHHKQCGCREIPEKVLQEMRRRGISS